MFNRYGNSCAVWDHTVLPATRQRLHSCLYSSQVKLVLDLATPEGCKADFTVLVLWPSHQLCADCMSFGNLLFNVRSISICVTWKLAH